MGKIRYTIKIASPCCGKAIKLSYLFGSIFIFEYLKL